MFNLIHFLKIQSNKSTLKTLKYQFILPLPKNVHRLGVVCVLPTPFFIFLFSSVLDCMI